MGYKWIDHFSVAVKSGEEAVATYRDKLGFTNLAPFRESGAGKTYVSAFLLEDDDRFLEVIAPTGPETFVARTIARRGEGFHMFVVAVDNRQETCVDLAYKGVQLTNVKGPGDPYIHPRFAHGALIQIRERTEPELLELLGRSEPCRPDGPHTSGARYRWLESVTVVVQDLNKAVATYRDTLGFTLEDTGESKARGCKNAIFTIGNCVGGRILELAEPLDPKTPIGQALERRGEGFHMATLAVNDLKQMVNDLRAREVQLIGGEGHQDQVFIHPNVAHGALIGLVERL